MSVAPVESAARDAREQRGEPVQVEAPDQTSLSAVVEAPEDWGQKIRLAGLRRFAAAITLLNLVGHSFLGFEPSWAHPLVALATAYVLEILFEYVDARAAGRPAKFGGAGPLGVGDFLLSAHISALAVSMLLYASEALWPIVFATAVAIGSKHILRVAIGGRSRHVMNPSNVGIALTLLLFPWVGIAPPYQFTENVAGLGDWLIPCVIIVSGSLINIRFTGRIVLLVAWLAAFALQAVVRHLLFDNALIPSLTPMTGMAFLLFTFYMVTDPATTPSSKRGQIAFGASVAAAYGFLMAIHVVFGLFFSLLIVCSLRGAWLYADSLRSRFEGGSSSPAVTVPASTAAGQRVS